VVDISHPRFEDQIKVVDETLRDLNSSDKPSVIIFNKTDAFSYVPKDNDDLTPIRKRIIHCQILRRHGWRMTVIIRPFLFQQRPGIT
jgi:GTP-binding protein HflX